jgi:hypothetical protein
MVNDERPRACLTCKRRKIKCDQVKPSCGRCVLAKELCKWIKPVDKIVIRFVDINQTVATRRDSAQDKPRTRPVDTSRAIVPRRDSSRDKTRTHSVDKDQAIAVRHRSSQDKPEIQSVDTPQAVTACYHKRIRPKASTKLENALHDDIETQALAFSSGTIPWIQHQTAGPILDCSDMSCPQSLPLETLQLPCQSLR